LSEISQRGYTVVGVARITDSKFIRYDGEPEDFQAYRITEDAEWLEKITPSIAVVDHPFCYIHTGIEITDGRALTGTVSPVDSRIRISMLGPQAEVSYEMLMHNQIATVLASHNNWTWGNSSGLNGHAIAWIVIDTATQALQSWITIGGTTEDSGGAGTACSKCQGLGYITVQEECLVCNGTGRVDGAVCTECGGDGKIDVDQTCPQCNGSGIVCLTGDTMITMADGSKRRLDLLCIGDAVMADDGNPTKIIKIGSGDYSHFHTKYYFENGTVIDETGPHRFYNADRRFWLQLDNWQLGDHAVTESGDRVRLMNVEKVGEHLEGFAMWTENGTYWANGLLSGTAQANQKLLANATPELAAEMAMSLHEKDILALSGWNGILPEILKEVQL